MGYITQMSRSAATAGKAFVKLSWEECQMKNMAHGPRGLFQRAMEVSTYTPSITWVWVRARSRHRQGRNGYYFRNL